MEKLLNKWDYRFILGHAIKKCREARKAIKFRAEGAKFTRCIVDDIWRLDI